MDKQTIVDKAHKMTTVHDLLDLLNDIKLGFLGVNDWEGTTAKPFSIGQINYYCNPNHEKHRFHSFKIKKKSGKLRSIDAPQKSSYKSILQCINALLQAIYTPSKYAMGFALGKSVRDNAERHLNQNYVLNIDLRDFFPSVDQARVWKRLQLPPFNFTPKISGIIAGLCSIRITRENALDRYVLPQGAPTSPIITNMICDKLDHRLAGLAKRFGLTYTRYADDITFSSKHYVYQRKGPFFMELYRIVEDQRFSINEDKTRLQKRGSRQEVTGVVVSDRTNVAKEYVRDIRNLLYIWSRYGYDVAYNKFLPKYRAEKGHVKKGVPDMANVIDGKLMYLKMIKSAEDKVYIKLREKFDQLCATLTDVNKTSENGVTYVDTMAFLDFERKFDTVIKFVYKSDKPNGENKETNHSLLGSQKHRYAIFELGGRKQVASVNKGLKVQDESRKNLLSISNCRDSKNRPFWLIHRTDKVLVTPQTPVDIKKLNDELDLLLKNEY